MISKDTSEGHIDSNKPKQFCLRVVIVMMKYHEQKQLGQESVYLAYISTSWSIFEGSQDIIVHHGRKSGQVLKWGRNLEA